MRASGGTRHVPGASLGVKSTHFIQIFKKRVLSRKLGQNMPKMRIF